MFIKNIIPKWLLTAFEDTVSVFANSFYLEKRGLEDHERSKFNRTDSKLAKLKAYFALSWLIILSTTLCVLWMLWSYFYWPCRFTSSGAVLVCGAVLGEVWLSHGYLRSAYKSLDRGLPVKVFAGSRTGIHINYFVFSEVPELLEFPGDYVVASRNEQYSAGLGSELSKYWSKLKWSLTNPLMLLLEVARPSEFTEEPLNISSPNGYTFTGYGRGWFIGKTGARIERSMSKIVMYGVITGTLVWAYGDILQTGALRCATS